LLGIPHALLWGVLAGFFRFIPYVGTMVAASLPIAMALAVSPGWHQAALVFGVFVLLELIIAYVVEPLLYGSNTGISSLAILVAALFWTILWGPVGLILSTPLTVCLTLMGRYVPQLSFLEVLFGDVAALPVEAQFYQRLLAFDQHEAREIAEAYLKTNSIESFYDSVLIPALTLAEKDRHLDSLETRTSSFVCQSIRELVEDLGERFATQPDEHYDDDLTQDPAIFNRRDRDGGFTQDVTLSGLKVVCIPAGDEADELVAMMLEQLATRLGCDFRRLPAATNPNTVEQVATHEAEVMLVSALPPFALSRARSLCKRLRQRLPEQRVILGLWGADRNGAEAQDRIGPAYADTVATSLHTTVAYLIETRESAESANVVCQTGAKRAPYRKIVATGSPI